MYKQLMFFLTAVLAALMIAECSTGKDTPAKPAQPVISECELKAVSGDIGQYGGALVLMALSDPKTFNPVTASETSSTEIIDHIFSGLVEMNGETMDYEPALARSWSTSSDGRTWTFTLRKGLQWSDGAPLTADDVIFTFDVIFDPRIPNSTADVLSAKGHPIKARKIDEQTVQITTAEPFAPLLNGLTTPILPKHKLEQPVRAGNFNSAWGIDTEPQKIVGCGPFVLNRYIPGQKVVLSRNPYYWKMDTAGKRLPYLDGLIYVVVPDLESMPARFMAGEADSLSVRGSDYAMLKRQEKAGDFTMYNLGPALGTEMLFFNMNPRAAKLGPARRRWFSDRNFRRALACAVDKKGIISTVYDSLAVPQNGPESSANRVYYNPSVPEYPYDPARARILLEQAGYKDRNGDGYIEDSSGRTVAFTIITNVENKERVDQGNIIKDDLQRLGIKVTLAPITFNSLVTKLDKSSDWEACILGFTGGLEPHSGSNLWKSSGQLHIWNPAQSAPATAWEERIDRIFDTAAVTLDKEKRKALYYEYQEIIADELPVIFLVTPTRTAAIRNRFGNLRPTISGAFWNEWQIYVR
ncbi:MAG: ABC transporter substrate-binding protein [bacterium]|nr:ABC transporter substrate-binding protein [bacterium]